ncbi:hypothetical protein [Leptolyngbya sp. FACHB-16]|uniref:hypothetical protein n=1 Tax=unclassified Leptolyngbya TaxID=2650499 RepID=UPI0016840744|nr:hypothetical protein [Leptolyngbya sp. FACHB-16]MBD2157806.1 hypothetical protein [Leptolyngbya sp. FACHB-16]
MADQRSIRAVFVKGLELCVSNSHFEPQFGLRAFSSAALRAALEKAHYCVRDAHAIMGGSAYPELTFLN